MQDNLVVSARNLERGIWVAEKIHNGGIKEKPEGLVKKLLDHIEIIERPTNEQAVPPD